VGSKGLGVHRSVDIENVCTILFSLRTYTSENVYVVIFSVRMNLVGKLSFLKVN